ncbi:Protein MtfA [Tepidimonas sediminis]|uniref:Protein MtfA n=1 Tax=Tepidimonas sediminis TaxID=2588941 RepID=A0A554WK88_9BURK|nr:M90 family metallopeptidase [Tepidimonas sediminis]TSE23989.1 Protein MtfA [Tepidimonas sediminis]
MALGERLRRLWRTAWRRWRLRRGDPAAIPQALWERVVAALPLLQDLSEAERQRLRALAAAFLARKRFSGAHGLVIDDFKALLVAAQACLPLRHRGLPALAWYDGFVGIILHPHEVRAPRRVTDEAGIVHEYDEELAGEAMQGGPIVLAWPRVLGAPDGQGVGHNLVIHEFAHAIDMHGKPLGQPADGCPRLPDGWLGLQARAAHALWRQTLQAAYETHRRRVVMHEHFGGPAPWLDAYAAQSPAEFFAVSCEAHCVDRARLAAEHPRWTALLDALFAHPQAPASAAALPAAVSDAAAP